MEEFKSYTIIFYEKAGIECGMIVEGELHYSIARKMIPSYGKYKGLKTIKKLTINIGAIFVEEY